MFTLPFNSDFVIRLARRGPSFQTRILKGKPTYMIYPLWFPEITVCQAMINWIDETS